MQNRYVGDTGDFGKYLLLKSLCENKLRLGVNWCLVENETHNNDGKHVNYLNNESGIYFQSDSKLFKQLQTLVHNSKRNVSNIPQSKVLPLGTRFFSEKIPFGTERFNWHDKSLKHLAVSDIIFYDPDNGLEINSCGKLHPNAVKYVYFDEVREAYKKGKSLIIYQHTNRSKKANDQIKTRINQLVTCLLISKSKISIVYTGQGTSRFYLIIKQPRHTDIIEENLAYLKKFEILKINPLLNN